eukprot:3989586-Ditylum_brightwellii.AAC.1
MHVHSQMTNFLEIYAVYKEASAFKFKMWAINECQKCKEWICTEKHGQLVLKQYMYDGAVIEGCQKRCSEAHNKPKLLQSYNATIILTAINKLEHAITLVTSQATSKSDTSKKKCQKCSLDKHGTNQCTAEEKKTPPMDNYGEIPWYLIPPAACTTYLKHHDAWHNLCMDCNPPSLRLHKPGDKHKMFVE